MGMEYEDLKRARDAFGKCFRPLLKDLVFNLAVGISRDKDTILLAVRCQFKNLDSVTEETKAEVLEILGTSFEFEGNTYPLDIAFIGIPTAK
jgi:hypothetical protein